jgi:hypothetical protein
VPTLHVTNGDCAAGILRTFLTDPVVVQADVLHEGPAPEVDDDEWLDLRAGFLAGGGGADSATIRQSLARSDRALDDAARFDEVVLWFEHDLFDQLQIARTLTRLRAIPSVMARTSLVCIDRFPGVEPFVGLGQLDAHQLASLEDARRAVTPEQFETAARVWTAFRSADPSELNSIRMDGSPTAGDALPFLRDAIGRFLAEYPSTRNGLSRTCHLALEALEGGPLEGGELFRRVQARESRPFMGDSPFFGHVRRLAAQRRPLVLIPPAAGHDDLRGHEIVLTVDGREALAGRLDTIAQNGIDEWRGGVHLQGRNQSPWRWDNVRETLVSWSELPTP